MHLRVGLAPDLEVGLRTGFARPELTAKLGLHRGEALSLSLSPSIGAWLHEGSLGRSVQLYGQPGLHLGVSLGEWSDLVIGVKLHLDLAHELDSRAWAFTLGPSLSLGWQARLWGWLRIAPELAVGTSGLYLGTGGPAIDGGLALAAGIGLGFEGSAPWSD